MSFAEWKKNNKVMAQYIPDGYRAMAYLVAQAAYKAGERQGRKDAKDVAKRAIELRTLFNTNYISYDKLHEILVKREYIK